MTPLEALQANTIPDWGDCVKMICAHLDNMHKTYVEIAFDPKTKEVAWSFEPTPLLDEPKQGLN